MSLQDDIARYANKYRTVSFGLTDHIAAALERDYYLVKLADLPEVTIDESDSDLVVVDGNRYYEDTPAFYRRMAYENLALALHLESRESEAAVLQARRDELVRRFWPLATRITPESKAAIEAVIAAEDRAAAAEAEVARLKGERG